MHIRPEEWRIENDPLKSQVRREHLEEKFGENAACWRCGYSNPVALYLADRSLLEKHHVSGIKHDPRVEFPMCRNCHAELHASLLDAGADMREQPTLLQKLEMILRARSAMHVAIGKADFDLANELRHIISMLDERFPNWRNPPEAK